MTFVDYAMIACGVCYIASAVGWCIQGKWWMGATFALYAATVLTLWFAGKGS